MESHKEKKRIPPQALIKYYIITGSATSDGDYLDPEWIIPHRKILPPTHKHKKRKPQKESHRTCWNVTSCSHACCCRQSCLYEIAAVVLHSTCPGVVTCALLLWKSCKPIFLLPWLVKPQQLQGLRSQESCNCDCHYLTPITPSQLCMRVHSSRWLWKNSWFSSCSGARAKLFKAASRNHCITVIP